MTPMAADAGDRVADLAIDPDAAQIRTASRWLAEVTQAQGIPDEALNRLDLCLNEVLANVLTHGRPASGSAQVLLRLCLRRQAGAVEATLTVSDAGPAFDMTARDAQPRPQTLAEAEPGGLGLVMIRSFADHLAYRYGEGRNHLSFGVRWAAEAGSAC